MNTHKVPYTDEHRREHIQKIQRLVPDWSERLIEIDRTYTSKKSAAMLYASKIPYKDRTQVIWMDSMIMHLPKKVELKEWIQFFNFIRYFKNQESKPLATKKTRVKKPATVNNFFTNDARNRLKKEMRSLGGGDSTLGKEYYQTYNLCG